MGEAEEEYEVESIVQARVEKKRKKVLWKYCVRWKDYSQADDTWEPEESFGGSEGILVRFWERANTGGRDHQDLSLFKVGESFVPTGPPRRKTKRKSLIPETDVPPQPSPEAESSSHAIEDEKPLQKRMRSASGAGESKDRPVKRVRSQSSEPGPLESSPPARGSERIPLPGRSNGKTPRKPLPGRGVPSPASTRRQQKKPARMPSPEVVPDSDEERTEMQEDNLEYTPGSLQDPPSGPRLPPENVPQEAVASVSEARGQLGAGETTKPTSHVDKPVSAKQDDLSGPMDEDKPSTHSHRDRAANPLVKMVDIPSVAGMDDAISVKARLLGRGGPPSPAPSPGPSSRRGHSNRGTPRASGSKPGPGRSSSNLMKKSTSSLLTFQKGGLKTVKGIYVKNGRGEKRRAESAKDDGLESDNGSLWGDMAVQNEVKVPGSVDHDTPAVSVPSGKELLQLAGLDAQDAEALPDFEDDLSGQLTARDANEDSVDEITGVLGHRRASASPPGGDAPGKVGGAELELLEVAPSTSTSKDSQPDLTNAALSLALAKDKLFPSAGATTPMGEGASAGWRHSTIFGPLGLGSGSLAESHDTPSTSSVQTCPFFLSLDTSVSVPVALSNTSPSPSGAPSLDFIVSKTPRGPPGKFYRAQGALSLLNTLRTGGPSARVVSDANASDEQKVHFDRFCSRLNEGELFVAMAGVEVLAFCSSDSAPIAQRLNFPSALLGLPGSVLVSRVIIENYSAYAEAALQADGMRW